MKLLGIITYFNLFDYPLTKEEILNFSDVDVKEWEDEKIEEKDGFYFLKGRSDVIQIRREREKYAKKLWKKTGFYMRFLKFVPFLKMVAVCNTLAFNHPEKDSDIDLFIVTSKNRIWTARILSTFLLQILGVRRHGKKVSGRFCLSFWCTEDAINLENIQIKPEDPYLAFWVLTLQPVLDNDLFENFVKNNNVWIEEKYGLRESRQNSLSGYSNFIAKLFEKILNGKFGNWIENKLRKKLKPRAEQKAKTAGTEANIIISDQMLKFHNHDKREEICRKWKANLK